MLLSNEQGGKTGRLERRPISVTARTARVLSLIGTGWLALAGCGSSDKGAPPPPVQPVDSGHHQEAGVRFACNNPQDLLTYDRQPSGFVLCSNGVSGPLHRAEVKACPSMIPRSIGCVGVGSNIDAGSVSGVCRNDGDCASIVEGHCMVTQRNTTCSCYPGCKSDADCGAGKLCECGSPTGQCAVAHCLSDAECGPGKLCLSASDGACGKVYACQAVDDQCAGDKDCKPPYSQCTFTGTHRECKTPPQCGF